MAMGQKAVRVIASRGCGSIFWVISRDLQLQLGEQFLDGELVVCGHGFQDAAKQGAGFERAVVFVRLREFSGTQGV